MLRDERKVFRDKLGFLDKKNERGEEYIGVQRIPVITLYGIDGVQQRIKLQKRYNLLQQCPKEEIMFQGRRMTL